MIKSERGSLDCNGCCCCTCVLVKDVTGRVDSDGRFSVVELAVRIVSGQQWTVEMQGQTEHLRDVRKCKAPHILRQESPVHKSHCARMPGESYTQWCDIDAG